MHDTWKKRVKSFVSIFISLIVRSDVVLQRCVPTPDSPVNVDVLTSLYATLNSPASLEQLLSDLYSTWTHILLLTLFAFGQCLILALITLVEYLHTHGEIHTYIMKHCSMLYSYLTGMSLALVLLLRIATGVMAWTFMVTVSVSAVGESETSHSQVY